MLNGSCAARADSLEPDRLPALASDPNALTLSGVSAGGFMALQFAVAHSAIVQGVGVIAAGPYFCARLDLLRIATVCLHGRPDWRESVAAVNVAAALDSIDPPWHLEGMRGWFLADGADPVVDPAVVQSAWMFLRHYVGDRAHYQILKGAGHSMPTLDQGGDCGATRAPFLNACRFDAAGQMLTYLYPRAPERADGMSELLAFDQTEFVSSWRRLLGNASLARIGYVFIPGQCRHGGCRLHVALHGCRQSAVQGGVQFMQSAGYNGWARRHATVVLYPQIEPTSAPWYAPWLPMNAEGCWDWWGYSGADYAVRAGVQIQALAAMVERLQGRIDR